jgi:hypothetical protein
MQAMHGFAWNACNLLHGTDHSQHHTNNKNFINQWNQQLLSTTSNDALFTYNCLSAKKYNYNMNGLHARHACVLPPPSQ